MSRGPHDEEIEEQDPDNDKAAKRLEEFLKRRQPVPEPPRKDEGEGGGEPPKH